MAAFSLGPMPCCLVGGPEHFKPDRRERAGVLRIPKHGYLPFGGGPRFCVGSHLATQQTTLVLATLAQHHRWELVPDQPIGAQASVTLRPRKGVRVRILPR